MKPKKSKQANLENRRNTFIMLGYIIALALTLVAFEWSTPEKRDISVLNMLSYDYEEEIIDVTREEKEKLLPKPPLPDFSIKIEPDSKKEEDPVPEFTPEIKPNEAVDLSKFDTPEPSPIETEYFMAVEEMPTFKGGSQKEFCRYITKRIKYPELAKDLRLSGRITARFIVNEKGEVTNVEIIKGIDPILDNAVIEAISRSPKWKPGRQRGIPVKVMFSMPFVFQLQ